MAKATAKPKAGVSLTVTFQVNEEEARALDALTGYGTDSAIKAFYKGCGSYYLEPYEAGLRSFLNTIGEVVSPGLNEVDRMREAIRKNVEKSSG